MSREKFGYIVIGGLITLVIVAAAIFVTVQIPVAVPRSTVQYHDVKALGQTDVCVGAVITASAVVDITQPTITRAYVSIQNATTGLNILGTQVTMPVRLYPAPLETVQIYTTTVPDLPPGSYNYVRAAIAENMDTLPSFLVIPFTVKPCP